MVPHENNERADAPVASGPLKYVFPNGVRLVHFIAVPAIGMGVLIAGFRLLEGAMAGLGLDPGAFAYQLLRTTVITVAMASLIAWLAFRHRREYETRLRARNETLRKTRDFLQSVIATSGEAILTVDERGTVTSWNRSAEEIFGWSAAEMIGSGLERLFPAGGEAATEQIDFANRLRAGRVVRHHETVRVRKDGRRIVIHVTASPLFDSDGTYRGSTALIHDVTQLKNLQAKVVEQERLAALGQMAAAVAHEVKNPLAGIRGAVEILRDGIADEDPGAELGDEVLRQVDRLNRTVQDLLLFARPRELRPVPTDVHLVIDRVLEVLRKEQSVREGVEIDLEFGESVPMVSVDPQQIEQVLFNLLQNAFQAMEYRGRVRVRTEPNGEYVRVRVRDSGPGVDEEHRSRIFEPFFTTRTRGTGLGLAIVDQIVRGHRGEVALNSPCAGGGAEFVVSLPKVMEV